MWLVVQTEGPDVSEEFSKEQQLEIMKQRLLAGGMSRRQVLKVAAAAAAGTAGAAVVGLATRADVGAAPLTGRGALRAASQTDEQLFYQDGI